MIKTTTPPPNSSLFHRYSPFAQITFTTIRFPLLQSYSEILSSIPTPSSQESRPTIFTGNLWIHFSKIDIKSVNYNLYRMEFPITRERLLTYRTHEAVLVETKQRVLKEVQQICKDVERTVLTTNDTKYIYRIPGHVKYPNLRPQNSQVSLVNPVAMVKELLVAIQHTFPDSTVVVDPLETYILIDWS